MSDKSLLRVSNLNWAYNREKTLTSIDLVIEEGSFTGITGPNGAGKTTLLRLLLKLLPPERETILISSRDIRSFKRKELAEVEAYVPQNSSTDFSFTVKQVVTMGRNRTSGRLSALSAYDRKIINKAMADTSIYDLRDKPVSTISGGELQRVVIARALAQEPSLILLDEPTSHLDIRNQINILNILKNLSRIQKIAIAAVFHDINHALEYCDQLLIMNKGIVEAHGAPAEIVTPENIERIYGVKVRITENPFTGNLHLFHNYS